MRQSANRDGSRWWLGLVLALALALRLWAIDWGAPYLYHPDEHLALHPALTIVRDGDLNPHWFLYPSLLIYLQAAVVAIEQPFVRAPLTTDPAVNHIGPWDALPAQWPFALGGRLVVAAFAIAGVWLLYRTGARYSGTPVGIAAALFLVSSALHNESSHYLTTDVAATTLLTAVLLFSVSRDEQPQLRRLIIAGFFAGLAAATKYTAGISLVVPLVVALTSSPRTTVRRWAAIATAAGVGFFLACPFALLDFRSVWSGILQQRQNYLGGYAPGSNWRWYLIYLYTIGLDQPLAVLCTLGFVAPFVHRVGARHAVPLRLRATLVFVPVVYFAMIASYPARAERNLTLLLPFLCLLGADICWRVIRRCAPERMAPALFGIVALLVAAPGILGCIRFDRKLASPDTRTVALQWIEANLPPGSRIAREEYTPQVPSDRYDVTYQWSLAFRNYAWYLQQRTDYLVLSSNVYGRALEPPHVAGPSGPAFYRFVFQQLPLAIEIAPAAQRPGPIIRIYQVPHG